MGKQCPRLPARMRSEQKRRSEDKRWANDFKNQKVSQEVTKSPHVIVSAAYPEVPFETGYNTHFVKTYTTSDEPELRPREVRGKGRVSADCNPLDAKQSDRPKSCKAWREGTDLKIIQAKPAPVARK